MKKKMAALVSALLFVFATASFAMADGNLGSVSTKLIAHPKLGGASVRLIALSYEKGEQTNFRWSMQTKEVSVLTRTKKSYGETCLLTPSSQYLVVADKEGNPVLDGSKTRALISLYLPNPINGARGEGCDQKVVVVDLEELQESMAENVAVFRGFDEALAELDPKVN